MGIAVAARARQAQGITAVNARKHLREIVVVFMTASYSYTAFNSPESYCVKSLACKSCAGLEGQNCLLIPQEKPGIPRKVLWRAMKLWRRAALTGIFCRPASELNSPA